MFEKDSDAHGDWAANAVLGGGVAQDDGFGSFGLPAAGVDLQVKLGTKG